MLKKSLRAGCFCYFPLMYVFNLNFNQFFKFFTARSLLEDSLFSHKAKLIKPKVVPCENLIEPLTACQSDVFQNAQSGNFRLQKIQSRIIYLFNSAFCFAFFSCQDERLLMSKRLGKGVFRPHQRMRDLWFSISGFGLFQIIRQKASLYWLVF